MRQVSESLAGRASYLTLRPMTRREQSGLGRCGLWDELLAARDEDWLDLLAAQPDASEDWRAVARRGGLPTPAVHLKTAHERAVWFDGYVRTYLERDLQDLSAIAALPDFRRLMRAACLRMGQLLNQTELGRDVSLAQPTVHRYLNLLETSYLLVRLSAYAVNRTKRFGWMANTDLSTIATRDELYSLYKAAHPDDTSNIVIGQQVGQIARFLLEMKAGDYVITPAADTESLHYGRVAADPSYFFGDGDDGCPYRHRRRVEWARETLKRSGLSVPFQNTIRSSLTVFAVSQRDEFLATIGSKELPIAPKAANYDPYLAVLEQVLELDDKEFEILVGHLLTALGFEGSEVNGKSGDGGVDATGELNIANLAKVKVFVQAKRYKLGSKVAARVVKQLRASIPSSGQGAFITTADFQAAADVALQQGFPRIGLVNGRQLVDLLVEHWSDIPPEFQERLGLKPGLVRA